MIKLNLGCGSKKLPGYVNVDSQPMENPDVVCNLGADRWPFDDNSVDEAVASHVMEHLTTGELFHFMQELYRVCANKTRVHVTLPHPRHDIYLADPTHQRPIMPSTLLMFSKGQLEAMLAQGKQLTPFWKYLGVDFYLESPVKYVFDADIDVNDPELAWKMKHLNNVVLQFECDLRVVK